MISDWRELPFPEIWCIDSEYYPGAGKANGGVDGDPITPLCIAGLEMRSRRTFVLWQDELGRSAPYRLDGGALIFVYMATAEFGFHIAQGWGEPAYAIDAYVEFRHFVNDGTIKSGDREKGFYSLAGALRYFLEDDLDLKQKDEMRDRIVQGPPFSARERTKLSGYCLDDGRALARLVPHIVPTIRSLPHAMFRAKFQWTMAQQERRGVHLDAPMLSRIRRRWTGMQADLVLELDRPYGCYEIDERGVPHWRKERFASYLQHNQMSWPKLESGVLDETDQTFREMAGKYPQVEQLRELRYSLSKLKLNALSVGNDGRNRTLLSAFGTKTARGAPSNSKFIFGPAKWLRFLITSPSGRVLVHRDYQQQEVRIAAIKSLDAALLAVCESGDVYLGIAQQLGFVRESMSREELRAVRVLFKVIVLGIQYGLGAASLAVRTGLSLFEAAEILARLRAQFRRWEEYVQNVLDQAGLCGEIGTPFGWFMQCPPGINPRTVRNFPVQSTAAEILHVLCILAERRGIELVAPIHDAVLAEGDIAQAEELSLALDRTMRDAAAVVLRGYELPTDWQIIRPGERYHDARGEAMWNTVAQLVTKLERGAA
jgi:hypothetical protein